MLDNFCEIKCDVDKYFGVLFYDFKIKIFDLILYEI